MLMLLTNDYYLSIVITNVNAKDSDDDNDDNDDDGNNNDDDDGYD